MFKHKAYISQFLRVHGEYIIVYPRNANSQHATTVNYVCIAHCIHTSTFDAGIPTFWVTPIPNIFSPILLIINRYLTVGLCKLDWCTMN